MLKKLRNMKKGEVIYFSDYSNYESGRCRNGGQYGFEVGFKKIGPDEFKVDYEFTTSEFPWSFGAWFSDNDEQHESDAHEVYSSEDVLNSVLGWEYDGIK